ncbi:response regulator [Nocardia pneumoniae]|uniref:response regulator n=1 Tax=Nocardia pneumoniae TaxID=228601 RepID=UPI00030B4C84|nr:response regulator [Nocardia pneumoniae]
MRCLIVDDSADFRRAARDMLERGGFTVAAEASNGADALRHCRSTRPELALVDIDLGGESGFDVAEQLRRTAEAPPAVILISTHAEQDFDDMIAESSAVGFLPKFALSIEAIQRLLGHDGESAGR